MGEFYKAFKGGLILTENRTGGGRESYRLILQGSDLPHTKFKKGTIRKTTFPVNLSQSVPPEH